MPPSAQTPAAGPAPRHATAVTRLLITNAMVIYGNAQARLRPGGHPGRGRTDRARRHGPRARAPDAGPADAVIDATGKYVMPGMVNTHMHWHEERMPGIPMPIQYERNLYLASGIDHRARGRRRLREDQAVARGERRAEDRRRPASSSTRRPNLGRTELARRRDPRRACARPRPTASTASRSAASIAISSKRCSTKRRRSGCRRRCTSASRRRPRGTTWSWASNCIEHFYGVGRRRARRHPELPARA